MRNYVRGELYRLLRRKSMYIYFAALSVGYLLLVIIRSSSLNAEMISDDAAVFFSFLPALAGGFLFAALYTDDLNAKNLNTLVGYGMSKVKIVLYKFALLALVGAIIFGLAPVFMYVLHAALGYPATAAVLGIIYAQLLRYYLMMLTYAALASIAVYGLQRATFSMVFYVVFALGIIGNLLSVLFNIEVIRSILPGLSNHLIAGITQRIFMGITAGAPVTMAVIEYIIYTGIALTLSALAFRKKEMEF